MPLEFWRTVTDRVRVRHPDAWFVGEVIHGDFADWVQQGGLDSVTQYELWKSIWSSLNDGNFFELAWTLDRHEAFVEDFVPLTFVGNHDVTRIASKLDRSAAPRRTPWSCCSPCRVSRASTTATSRASAASRRIAKAATTRSGRLSRPNRTKLAPDGWPIYRLHQQLIGLRRREPWLTGARIEVVDEDQRTAAGAGWPGPTGSHSSCC